MPATSLPDLEQRLEACLLELEKTHRARPSLPTALARAEAGQRIDDLLDEIAEIQRMIDTSPAETSIRWLSAVTIPLTLVWVLAVIYAGKRFRELTE
jgi:hypothetical protein